MALDLSKLTDAVAKVADLAKSHGDAVALVAQHQAELSQAQHDIDSLVAQLMDAVSTPAEAHGIAAVAAALSPDPAVSIDAMVQAMKAPQ
jgi:hypothetical protein